MGNKYSAPRFLIGISLLVAAGVLTYQFLSQYRDDPVEQVLEPLEYTPFEGEDPPKCLPVPEESNRHGTQGMKIWSGSTLRAFNTGNDLICIPDGWEPIGHSLKGEGWALYPPMQGGVIVKEGAFEQRVRNFENTLFDVVVVWPRDMPKKQVEASHAIIEHAFVKVGAIHPELHEDLTTPFTVLMTSGVAGSTRSRDTRIYPEPGYNLATLVRSPDQARAEELFIHAVAHLYNRHRYWSKEWGRPFPVPKPDWEELVATWTETAFIARHDWRMHRLEYLMNVHEAVRTKKFSLIESPPFDNREAFDSIRADVIVQPGSPDIDYQYGHYILAPLSMVAIQGLLMELVEAGTIQPTSVEQLLTDVHVNLHPSFFHALEELLPTEEQERIHGWMHGGQAIPEELIRKAAEHYRQLNAE